MLSTRKQVITIIVIDITVIMNNTISELCSMNEEPEMLVTFGFKKKIHRNKLPGIPRCREMAG
jgi:hypothetical protein